MCLASHIHTAEWGAQAFEGTHSGQAVLVVIQFESLAVANIRVGQSFKSRHCIAKILVLDLDVLWDCKDSRIGEPRLNFWKSCHGG